MKFIKGSCNNCLDLGLEPDIIFHLGIPSSSPSVQEGSIPGGGGDKRHGGHNGARPSERTKKVVFASSSSLYNGVPTPHREDACDSGSRTTIPRPGWPLRGWLSFFHQTLRNRLCRAAVLLGLRPARGGQGVFANMITQFLWGMRAGEHPVIFGDGTQTRDFTLREGHCECSDPDFKEGHRDFQLGQGKAFSFSYVVDLINLVWE